MSDQESPAARGAATDLASIDEFDRLKGTTQIRRLQAAARTLLRRYGIDKSRLRLLAHHRQTTFRVDSESRRERLLIRFHRSHYRPPDAVRSEFEWLRSFERQRRVVVPRPLATLDREDVIHVAAKGLPDDLHCSVLRWVDGRRYFRKNGPGVRVLGAVGRLMAHMHDHAEKFRPSSSFSCPVWNGERLFGSQMSEAIGSQPVRLTAPEIRLCDRAERQVGMAMRSLGTGSGVFGVIHGDLIQSNYLVQGDDVHFIDFADFGFGHFLYDMAITLFGLHGLDPEARQRRAFLEGYRQVRDLPLDHERFLDVFIAGRALVPARFVLGSSHPGDRAIAERYVRRIVDGLPSWLG